MVRKFKKISDINVLLDSFKLYVKKNKWFVWAGISFLLNIILIAKILHINSEKKYLKKQLVVNQENYLQAMEELQSECDSEIVEYKTNIKDLRENLYELRYNYIVYKRVADIIHQKFMDFLQKDISGEQKNLQRLKNLQYKYDIWYKNKENELDSLFDLAYSKHLKNTTKY